MIKKVFLKRFYRLKVLFTDKTYLLSFFGALFLLTLMYIVNYFASSYNDTKIAITVDDIILDNLPTYNLEFMFTWGVYSVIVSLIIYFFVFKPELIPFAIKTFAILFLIRAGFILLTGFGPPEGFFYDVYPDHSPLVDSEKSLSKIGWFRNDLFFSGHAALPFVAFLLLKGSKFKWFYLFASLVMSATVLLMHIHYSVDVFAAYFIGHGVYVMSDKIFNKLNKRFAEKVNSNF